MGAGLQRSQTSQQFEASDAEGVRGTGRNQDKVIGMNPFAFHRNCKRPGRTRQGFAIRIAALRARLTEPARPHKTAETKAKGATDKSVSAVKSLTAAGPFKEGVPAIVEG